MSYKINCPWELQKQGQSHDEVIKLTPRGISPSALTTTPLQVRSQRNIPQ